MCFSAGASFSAAGALSVIGLLTVKKVPDKRLYPLSLIPLFFALQQFSEGIVWLALGNKISEAFILPASYIFIGIACIAWPTYISIATLVYEKQIIRKRLLYIPFLVGLSLSAYAVFHLLYYEIQAQIVSCHIFYSVKDTVFSYYFTIPYLIATIAPFFISSIKKMWILGLVFLISFIVSFFVYTTWLTSIWCFFAAIISMLLYWVIGSAKHNNRTTKP
jgi:hypothetical protein